MLPTADAATIETFEARMVELLGEAPDEPTRAEYRAFVRDLAAAKAKLVDGVSPPEPPEERLTEAEWLARTGHPSPVAVEPAEPAIDEAPAAQPAVDESPATEVAEPAAAAEPKPEKKKAKRKPYERKRKQGQRATE